MNRYYKNRKFYLGNNPCAVYVLSKRFPPGEFATVCGGNRLALARSQEVYFSSCSSFQLVVIGAPTRMCTVASSTGISVIDDARSLHRVFVAAARSFGHEPASVPAASVWQWDDIAARQHNSSVWFEC